VIAAVFIVSRSFSLPHIIPNNSFAANLSASGNAGAIITGTTWLPTPFPACTKEHRHHCREHKNLGPCLQPGFRKLQ
jgi:hypothetical protein